MRQYKDIDKAKLIKEIINSLNNRLNEYRNILDKYKNDINIINICSDLITTIKDYILLFNNI